MINLKKPVIHTLINITFLIIGFIIAYTFEEHVTNPANYTPNDNPNPDARISGMMDGVGAIVSALIVYVLIFIIWSLRVIWSLKTQKKKSVLLYINLIILLVPWSPFLVSGAFEIKERSINWWHRNQIINSNDNYKAIPFPEEREFVSIIETNDSLILSLKGKGYYTNRGEYLNKPAKYYIIKDNKLIEISKSLIFHLINNMGEIIIDKPSTWHNHNWFKDSFKNTKHTLSFDTRNKYIEDFNVPTTYLYDTLLKIKIDSLKGFDDLIHCYTYESNAYNRVIENAYYNARKKIIYIPFFSKEKMYVAIKKNKERVKVNEINFNSHKKYSDNAIRNGGIKLFIKDEYSYILIDGDLFFHKIDN